MDKERLKELRNEKRMSRIVDGKIVPGIESANALVNMVQKYFKEDFKMVEIGSYEGKSTEVFAVYCQSVVSIDAYTSNDFVEQDGRKNLERAEKVFKKLIEKYDNVSQLKVLSVDAVNNFEDGTFDAVYIDGNHKHESVVADIEAWYPKVKNGGLISGHDYQQTKQAIDETLGYPTETFGSNWVTVKGSANDKMRE